MKCYIFGAKAIALSVCEAVRYLYPKDEVVGFLVSSMKGNPGTLAGLPVKEIAAASKEMSNGEKKTNRILVAAPEDVHQDIIRLLLKHSFSNYKLVDSETESKLMGQYYRKKGMFPALHDLPASEGMAKLSVYAARFYRDKPLIYPPQFPSYVHSILLGCSISPRKELENGVDFCDHIGENISSKNPDYCEMTAFYWVWKNALKNMENKDYAGICHYRRMLDIPESDLKRIAGNGVDAVLPYPLMHAPDIREHHTRYVQERDWELMLDALQEIHPQYARRYEEIFSQPYFYNYNLIIARKPVFADYCAWLFPVLFRAEEFSISKGRKHGDRYLAYMSESLFTLYFLYHQNDLNICHAGRRMFT